MLHLFPIWCPIENGMSMCWEGADRSTLGSEAAFMSSSACSLLYSLDGCSVTQLEHERVVLCNTLENPLENSHSSHYADGYKVGSPPYLKHHAPQAHHCA